MISLYRLLILIICMHRGALRIALWRPSTAAYAVCDQSSYERGNVQSVFTVRLTFVEEKIIRLEEHQTPVSHCAKVLPGNRRQVYEKQTSTSILL